MFGLGIWEILGIVFLACLLFGPRFIVNTFRSLWKSLTGFVRSFQSAASESEALGPEQMRALKAAQEDRGEAHS